VLYTALKIVPPGDHSSEYLALGGQNVIL